MSSRREALQRQIEEAFADVPYPGDDHIIDDPNDWEAAELLACFKGKHWKELGYEDLFQNSLSFVGIDAYAFYLPAYLLGALDDYKDLISVVFGLCPTWSEEDAEHLQWQLRRYDRLNNRQRAAVRSFLEYMREEMSQYFGMFTRFEDALARYWSREAASDGGGAP
ncbi:MAG TPA: DUF6714 family protein [Polyangia bacterium]|jgi:hypothetical protein|nr:DUF6714 family protein [Polyangia bacterium]